MSAGTFEGMLARDAMAKLAEAGITPRLGDDGRIFAGPASKLTPAIRQLITEHKDGMALELSPPRERELRLQNHELKVKAHKLERELAFEKNIRQVYEGLATAAMAQLRKQPKAIPENIHRALVSLCHPDHNQDRQATATLATAWLNQQKREVLASIEVTGQWTVHR